MRDRARGREIEGGREQVLQLYRQTDRQRNWMGRTWEYTVWTRRWNETKLYSPLLTHCSFSAQACIECNLWNPFGSHIVFIVLFLLSLFLHILLAPFSFVFFRNELHHSCVLFDCLCERVKMAHRAQMEPMCSFTVFLRFLFLCVLFYDVTGVAIQVKNEEPRKVKRVKFNGHPACCADDTTTVPFAKKQKKNTANSILRFYDQIYHSWEWDKNDKSQFSCYFSEMQFWDRKMCALFRYAHLWRTVWLRWIRFA